MGFIPAGAPIHLTRLSRLQTALVARRNVLEIIPSLSYRQPIVSGEMLMRWHMLADPGGYRRVMNDNLAEAQKATMTILQSKADPLAQKLLTPLLMAPITIGTRDNLTPQVDPTKLDPSQKPVVPKSPTQWQMPKIPGRK